MIAARAAAEKILLRRIHDANNRTPQG